MCRQCEGGQEAAESLDVMADDEREAWVQRQLADAPGLTPEQRARAARLLASDPTEATTRATRALTGSTSAPLWRPYPRRLRTPA